MNKTDDFIEDLKALCSQYFVVFDIDHKIISTEFSDSYINKFTIEVYDDLKNKRDEKTKD